MQIKKLRSLTCLIAIAIFLMSSKTSFADTINSPAKYTMDITFSEKDESIKTTETVKITNNYGKAIKDLVFHLYPDSYGSSDTLPGIGKSPGGSEKLSDEQKGDIDIEKVIINNKEMHFTEDNEILKIHLEAPLQKDEQVEVTISFTLKIPMGTNRLGYTNDVYSITNWYPILSVYDPLKDMWDENRFNPIGESNYSEIADYDVTLHVPGNMVVASTGVTSSEDIKNNIKTIKINAEKVRDFVFIMSKNFRVVSKDVNGIKVNSYYLVGSSKENNEKKAVKMRDTAADALSFFGDTFGKYPYPEFDVVETYLSGGAMEYPQLVQMGKYFPMPENLPLGYTPWDEVAVVHETGHQWWYVSVGNNEFLEPILDESLTQFSTAYYFEKRHGKYDENGVLSTIRGRMFQRPGSSFPINSSVDKFKNWGDYSYTIYQRGQEIYEDLRSQVGEEKFLKIMRTYFDKYLYKNASVNGFLEVVREAAGDSISENIRQSMNSENYYPKNLELKEEERMTLSRERLKSELKERESQLGLTVSSIVLKGIQGESIYIVKPSNLSDSESQSINDMIQQSIAGLQKEFGIKVYVKEDKNLTPLEKQNNNLIILGSLSNNDLIKEMNSSFPLIITPKGIFMDDIIVKGNDISGSFITKHPENKDKLVLVYFWTKQLKPFNFSPYDSYQYMINIGDKKQLQGRF